MVVDVIDNAFSWSGFLEDTFLKFSTFIAKEAT